MMIFLAGLQGISREQYEAASIDGAGKIQSFFYVTLPGLKSVIQYVVMITVIQAMKLFTQPYVMTKGGPQNSTRTLVYYIYEQGFQKRNFGYACAVAAVFFVIVISLSLGMKKIIKAGPARKIIIWYPAPCHADIKIMEFMAVFGSFKKPQGSNPSFTSRAFKSPLSGLELYITVQRMATTTMEVTCGLKYAARNIETPFLLEEIKRASARARTV